MLGFSVNPEGSKRVLVSPSTRAFSGTPYCRPMEIESARSMSWLAGRALYGRLAGILTAGCVAGFSAPSGSAYHRIR